MKFFNSIIFLCYIFYFQVALSTYNVVPFLIPYDQVAIDILKEKVANTKWPDQLEDINDWSYGAPKDIIFEMASYFMSNFSWLEQSNKLNVILPQYSVQIGDHKLHFVHKLSSNSNAKPLIFIHGWPGSFMECLKIMPMLTEPQNYGGDAKNAFHVVCPSIPGYGFSTRPSKKGFDQQACAELFDVLMHDVLGYSQYFIQGGDWGSVVGSLQASLTTSKSRVLGLHINMIPTPPPFMKGLKAILSLVNSLIFQSWYYTDMERKALANMPKVLLYESGYFHEQSTRPQTLAYGITDSPVALMAWMFEKFYYWSDCHGDIFSRFTHDELLTNFMIYWITNTAGSSVRFYYEFWHGGSSVDRLFHLDVEVPTAMAIFPVEIFAPVKYWASFYYRNIVHWHHFPKGGHFAALEEPLLLANDIWQFRSAVESSITDKSASYEL